MPNGDPGPVIRVLSPEQQAEAHRLYWFMIDMRAQGTKLALAHLEDEIGIHAIGRRANVARLLTI